MTDSNHILALGAICQVTDCEHKTAPFQDHGIPMIRTPNIGKGVLLLDGVRRVSEETYRRWSRRAIPQPGDLIMAREAPVGNVAIIPPNTRVCLGQRTVLLRPNSELVEGQYLNYLLNGGYMNSVLLALSNGATVGHLNVTDIRKLPLPALPPLTTQRKIAAILATYDDLIENNNKRIALLEKAAEEIYREWFVRLRFPGWETTPFFKGIPEGWEIEAFDKVVSIKPQEAIEKADLKPYVGMDDLSLTTMIFSHSEYRTGSSGAKFRNGDTLFPRITPSLENGKRGYVMNLAEDEVGFGSTEFIVMREKKLTREFIYLLTCTSEFRKHAELSMIGASGRQRVQEDCFSFFLVKVPPKDLLVAFSSVVSPMFSQIKTLHESIKNLVETRDLLLSRLISGKLPVDDLDIQFPPSMMPIEEPDHA